MKQSDEDLMVSYQKGSKKAFDELYRRYAKRVYGYLNKKLSNTAQVDELFQMIFLKLHQSKKQFDSKYKFAPWLFTICRTVIIDAARTRKIYDEARFEPLEDVAVPPKNSVPAIDTSGLSKEQQKLLEMRYASEMEFEEMATKLNTSTQTVRKRVNRAIQKLREQLKK